MSHLRPILCPLIALGFCLTVPNLVAETPKPEATKKARPTLVVGMTADEVLAIAGKPATIRKVEQEGAKVEIWQYTFSRLADVRQVPFGTTEVPYINPKTGEMKMLQESTYTEERIMEVEVTNLLMVDGKLFEMKRGRKYEKSL